MNKFYFARDITYKNCKLKSYTKSNLIKRTIRDANNATYKVFEMNYPLWLGD